jgi:alpha-galactosidase/6-phospho-beta-glucosidase family protein
LVDPDPAVLGQETTGPGGFAKALRTVPVGLGIAEVVAKRARPNGWIVDFTNPVGLDHAGLNRLSWIRQVLVDDVDRLPELSASGHLTAHRGRCAPLRQHPQRRHWDLAVAVLDETLRANRAHLPQFFPPAGP